MDSYNYYIHNLYNNMRYIYDTDSAGAKRSYVDYMRYISIYRLY